MPTADIILRNASVITMEPGQPGAELVAVKGGKVRLIGDNGELGRVRGAKTRVIDCQGKTVVPGFNDAHCHIYSFVRKLVSLDLSPPSVSSIDDIKSAVRRQAQNTPRGEWITGTDYNDFYLAEKRHPNRRDLDEVAPHHPVVLAHRSLHACVLNSQALSRAGITGETPEPPAGLIDRELDTGEPSGLLFEMLGYVREDVVPPISEDDLLRGIKLAGKHYLSLGITSVQDATVVNNFARWQALRRFIESGDLKSRVTMMPGAGALPELLEQGLSFGSGDSHLRLGVVKLMLNEATGDVQPTQSELNRLVLDVRRAGFPAGIHAVERRSVAAAISAIEYAFGQSSPAGMRYRIEHCSQCPPELLERLPRLGVVIVTQPPFIYYSGERYLATLPADQLEWLYRIRSFHRRGLTVAGSSDCPVVPANPLVGIYAAVTRRAETGQLLLPDEGISAGEALAMYNVNAACAEGDEGVKGSLTPGRLADMAVLSDDPLKAPPERIKDIKVEMTIIGGEVVWEA